HLLRRQAALLLCEQSDHSVACPAAAVPSRAEDVLCVLSPGHRANNTDSHYYLEPRARAVPLSVRPRGPRRGAALGPRGGVARSGGRLARALFLFARGGGGVVPRACAGGRDRRSRLGRRARCCAGV